MIGIDSVKKEISGLCGVVIVNEMRRVEGIEPPTATHQDTLCYFSARQLKAKISLKAQSEAFLWGSVT